MARRLPKLIVDLVRSGRSQREIATMLNLTEQQVVDRFTNPMLDDPAPQPDAAVETAIEAVTERLTLIERDVEGFDFQGPYGDFGVYPPGAVVTYLGKLWFMGGTVPFNSYADAPGRPAGWYSDGILFERKDPNDDEVVVESRPATPTASGAGHPFDLTPAAPTRVFAFIASREASINVRADQVWIDAQNGIDRLNVEVFHADGRLYYDTDMVGKGTYYDASVQAPGGYAGGVLYFVKVGLKVPAEGPARCSLDLWPSTDSVVQAAWVPLTI